MNKSCFFEGEYESGGSSNDMLLNEPEKFMLISSPYTRLRWRLLRLTEESLVTARNCAHHVARIGIAGASEFQTLKGFLFDAAGEISLVPLER